MFPFSSQIRLLIENDILNNHIFNSVSKQSAEILTIADFDFTWEKFDFLCNAIPITNGRVMLVKNSSFL